jgi:hypothetical protein
MAQTAVDICNSALQRVGATTISSLSDTSPEAKACNVVYDSNRRDELRKYKWNFAITRAVLNVAATAPAFGYAYRYALPADCLRVLRSNDYDLDWQIEAGYILTNNDATTINLRYIKDITDPALFDSSFYNVIAVALAIDINERLTQSNTKRDLLMREYREALMDARRVNAFEAGPVEMPDDGWLIARI